MFRPIALSMALLGVAATASAAGPEVVNGPGVMPECFAPYSSDTQYFRFEKKEPPYRIALANGFVGNTWRIQMIKTLKAYAEQDDVKPFIKELKVVSTGTDVAAQVAAIDNFINAGYDAILTIAVNPTAFTPVIKRANRAGVVLVPFDNVLDSDKILQVNEDQSEMGRIMARWLTKNVGSSGKILEVRGLPGNSVDRDRHQGFREIMEASGNDFDIIEVVGNWDDGTAQKVVADAVAVHGQFDGMYVQGGSTGSVRALMDAGHPFIPIAGEAENGFRKLCAEHADEGLLCSSAGQSPGLVAIAAKTAITALQGEVLPQYVSVPIPLVEHPDFQADVNYFPELGDNFFTPNEFPPCGVNITATEIMAKSEQDQ
ncbi:MAG: ABC transporter substrate-binding protein [Candidatus Competibacteraceae bacterium]|nr:ABC transporter substrate-binding protein [Candidatus Competibacteraceae bacterium]MCB1804902.1 ABC transporter substrate-binding protein [Candidatus Competibacteraceae bacterium]MCB1812042.1 ABC transporter substrate-binding protein [Candidatus Competibacteraceae bacterium]